MNNFHQIDQKSELACHSCRRRKVKCDRAIPQCTVCEHSSQVCSYPVGPLKPGPKIGMALSSDPQSRNTENKKLRATGSSQRQRKRRRGESYEANDDDLSVQSNGPDTHSLDGTASLNNTTSTCDKASSCTATSRNVSGPLHTDGWDTDRPESRSSLQDLSFILHPSHEPASPEKERQPQPRMPSIDQYGLSSLDRASMTLGITRTCLDQMIKLYFDNMTSINLFHEPTFFTKIDSIESATQVDALLAAMLAFASRFYEPGNDPEAHLEILDTPDSHKHAAYFRGLASSNADQALKDCGDDPPPLCLLQAFILTAHCQLTQGVLGTAWRTLGTCVRLAYEMNLHLVDMKDADKPNTVDEKTWCEDEEKRRAWWAIWEMDVFATTIRRTPTAIDWSQTETMLPAEDEYWFQCQIRPSCYFEMDPIARWKTLRDSGNQSPKSWFIVINSLMKDAQKISTPHGIPSRSQSNNNRPNGTSRHHQSHKNEDARQKLEGLANSVQCFLLALPAHLRYRNQYLGFDARTPGQLVSVRQLHCSIYNIHVMTQLARLMIYRYNVFGNQSRHALSKTRSRSNVSGLKESGPHVARMDDLAIQQYFEAADNILTVVSRSCEDHIQYTNPFLSYTIWLASAVQLVRRGIYRPDTNQSLIKSKFEVLHLTYKKSVEFWDIKAAVQQNFETLEAQLEDCQTRYKNTQPRRVPAASRGRRTSTGQDDFGNPKDTPPLRDGREGSHVSEPQSCPSNQQMDNANEAGELRWRSATSNLPNTPNGGGTALQGEVPRLQPPNGIDYAMKQAQMENAHTQILSPQSIDPLLSLDTSQTSGYSFDNFSSASPGQYTDWWCTDFFNDMQNLLSGYPAYGILGTDKQS